MLYRLTAALALFALACSDAPTAPEPLGYVYHFEAWTGPGVVVDPGSAMTLRVYSGRVEGSGHLSATVNGSPILLYGTTTVPHGPALVHGTYTEEADSVFFALQEDYGGGTWLDGAWAKDGPRLRRAEGSFEVTFVTEGK